MGNVRVVDALPVLDQSAYGELPEIPENTVLVLFGTPWQRAEPEFMAAAMIQACINADEWRPIAANLEFDEVLMRFSNYHFMPQVFWNGFHELWEAGDIEVVEFEGCQYSVPLLTMVDKALRAGGGVGCQDEHAAAVGNDQPTEPLPPLYEVRSRRSLIAQIRRVIGR